MPVFEAGVRPGLRAGARRGGIIAETGRPFDAIGRAHGATSRERYPSGFLAQTLGAAARLIFPVILLLAIGAASAIYADQSTNWLDGAGTHLNLGLALLPLSFFAIHLTNRRYGAGYALAQVVAGWFVALCAMPGALEVLKTPPAELRTVAAFAVGLFVAQISAVIVFDGLRGPSWWQAPFYGSLFGSVVLCLIAFPAAYAGIRPDWSDEMVSYALAMAAAGSVLLIPYWMLRALMPPRSGLGGY